MQQKLHMRMRSSEQTRGCFWVGREQEEDVIPGGKAICWGLLLQHHQSRLDSQNFLVSMGVGSS